MENEIDKVVGYIDSERASLTHCTDIKREEMITQRLHDLEISLHDLHIRLNSLREEKLSQSGKKQLLFKS